MSGRLIIVGGCGGIGRRLVADAAARGWIPVVLDLPVSLAAHPPEGESHPVDATNARALTEIAARLGKIDGVVNLCGFMGTLTPISEQPAETWETLIKGNLTSAFHAAQAFAPRITPGGSMVLTGSGLGHYARPGYGAYAIAKAGIAALTRQLAVELAPDIRVNCVSPAAVDTAFLRGGTGRSDETEPSRIDHAAYTKAIPLGRIAQPRDVTGPILFLLSQAAGYMTGQVLHVNGGTYMG